MSPVRLIILIGAAVAAIAAAFLVRNLAQAPDPTIKTVTEQQTVLELREVSQTKVLVTRRDLDVGDLITVDDMEWADWPEKNIVEGYRTEADFPTAIADLAGSIVRVPMYDREPILPRKLVLKGETGMMAALLAPGMRAMSVEISTESASGGFILPNDRVDVILTHEVATLSQDAMVDKPTTTTILQNVRILAIDQVFLQDEEDGASQIGNTATLEVSGKEAELIALAQRMGTLSLSLRPWSDVGEAYDRAARIDLLEGDGFGKAGGVTIFRNGHASGGGLGGS